MYQPRYFQMQDREAAAGLIHQNSFGLLVCTGQDGVPRGGHLLMELVEEGEEWTLWGHLARANSLWKCWNGQEALAIFSGPHHYISPSWYNHPNVPTWNYASVHCYGVPEMVNDDQVVLNMLKRAVAKFEKPDSTYSLDQLPEKVLQAQLQAIVPFKIPISKIEAGFKLSQNRDEVNFNQVLENLRAIGSENAAGTVDYMELFGRK